MMLAIVLFFLIVVKHTNQNIYYLNHFFFFFIEGELLYRILLFSVNCFLNVQFRVISTLILLCNHHHHHPDTGLFLSCRNEVKLLSRVRLFATPWTVAY